VSGKLNFSLMKATATCGLKTLLTAVNNYWGAVVLEAAEQICPEAGGTTANKSSISDYFI
jgi:hypothetical protein